MARGRFGDPEKLGHFHFEHCTRNSLTTAPLPEMANTGIIRDLNHKGSGLSVLLLSRLAHCHAIT